MNKYILGSSSPRRGEIIRFFSLPFVQVSPNFDEDAVPFTGIPPAYVLELAKGKAESLVDRFPEALILTADTIVYKEGGCFWQAQRRTRGHKSYTRAFWEVAQRFYRALCLLSGKTFSSGGRDKGSFSCPYGRANQTVL